MAEEQQSQEDLSEGGYGPFKELVNRFQRRDEKPRRFHVITNPASGKDQPILKTLNAAFRTIGADWDIFITKESGDARRLAKESIEAGADVVVAYGGDGTVMEVASGLTGSTVPLGILPGGTANVMANELNIPLDLVAACTVLINPEALIRKVDIGRVKAQGGESHFLLRASMGFEAAMVEGADREMKDRLGLLAYTFSALQVLADPVIATYSLTLDGEQVETRGLTCIIANSGNIGTPGVSLAPTINVSDGMLDVIVVTRGDLPALVSLAASVVGGNENSVALQHWQVREVSIRSEPEQSVQVDGEILGTTPISAYVIPDAVRVIVPAEVNDIQKES